MGPYLASKAARLRMSSRRFAGPQEGIIGEREGDPSLEEEAAQVESATLPMFRNSMKFEIVAIAALQPTLLECSWVRRVVMQFGYDEVGGVNRESVDGVEQRFIKGTPFFAAGIVGASP